MSVVSAILRIAGIEALVCVRSWLFRFCTLFVFIMLGVANIYFFIPVDGISSAPWWVRAVPSSVPYFNVLALTVFECLIIMFGAVESMKREYLFDTSDSLHTRDTTNLEYITGKALGLILPVVMLNVLFLAAILVVNSVFMLDVSVVWRAYALYPLLINLPALVFVTGLSFMGMNLVRHTPLAMLGLLLILLVPFGVSSGHIARIMDYSAVHLPMLYSDFVGFGNLGEILFQRGSVLLLGLGLISLSSVTFRRLPQSRPAGFAAMISGVVFGTVSVSLALVFLTGLVAEAHLRSQMQELNEEYVQRPRVRMTACHLDLEHIGSQLVTRADITIENPTGRTLDRVCFSLNPGYTVEQVSMDGQPLTFTRDTQILDITLASPLQSGASRALRISYHGTPDDCAAYPDIDEDQHQRLHRLFTYVIDKRHGFVTPNYILLTPESLWYPSPGIPYGVVFPDANQKDFVDFSFELTTDPAFTVITQGDVVSIGDGPFQVVADSKLPSLTLIVGDYEERSAVVDSVAVKLFTKPGHEYFAEYFEGCNERVVQYLNDFKGGAEYMQAMSYPYSRFLVVETPVQFYAYERPWLTYTDTVQPEINLLPERGSFFINGVNFRSMYQLAGRPGGMAFDKNQSAGNLLQAFFDSNISYDNIARTMSRNLRSSPRTFTLQPYNWTVPNYFPRYRIDAQFHPFLVSYEFNDYPIFDTIMEMRNSTATFSTSNIQRMTQALTADERASLALADEPFSAYVKSDVDFDTMDHILRLKATQLFGMVSAESDSIPIYDWLRSISIDHRFEQVSMETFDHEVCEASGIEQFSLFLDDWYHQSQLPFFHIPEVTSTEVGVEERAYWQTSVIVTNTEPVRGTMYVLAWGGGETLERYVSFEGQQSKEIGFVTDGKLSSVVVKTLVSQNIPNTLYIRNMKSDPRNHFELFDGVRTVPYSPPLDDPGVIVVDNLDEGFAILRDPPAKEDHVNFEFGMNPGGYILSIPDLPPSRWGKAVFLNAYGELGTAHYTQRGPGDGEVCWTATIPDAGRYELEFYLYDITSGYNWSIPEDHPDFNSPLLGDYHLSVVTGDTSEPIVFQPRDDGGWQYVATFDLKSGPVEVHLTNESNGRCIYADAIRWVKKNTAQTSQLITF